MLNQPTPTTLQGLGVPRPGKILWRIHIHMVLSLDHWLNCKERCVGGTFYLRKGEHASQIGSYQNGVLKELATNSYEKESSIC